MQAKVNCKHEDFNSTKISVYVCKTCFRTRDEIILLKKLQRAQESIDMVVSCFKMSEENLHYVRKNMVGIMHDAREREQSLIKVLQAWEQWEADIITENKCWGADGMNSTPRLTTELLYKMLELQGMRNKILHPNGLEAKPDAN